MNFNFIETAFELIDLRSFSNLWFWIALAVTWSSSSHWVVGVPFDVVRRAARGDERALGDLSTLGSIHARRLIGLAASAGLALTGLAWFVATALLVLGLVYRVEFAQALFFLLVPLSLVGWLNLRTARRMASVEVEALPAVMLRHRRIVQAMGGASIFVTALWGMWANLNASVLG